MIRSASVLACALVLAGCGSTQSNPPAAAPVASTSGVGQAVIESISLSEPSASAGGSQPSGPYRVTLRKDDGSTQTLLVESRAFLVGDRVRVLPDGRLVR